MKNLSFQMGFEIKTAAGPILKPTKFTAWDQNSRFSEFTPEAPFKYRNDVLTGLTFHKMNHFNDLGFTDKTFAEQSLKALDPYSELYKKSASRLRPVTKNIKSAVPPLKVENFEKKFTDFWDMAITPKGVDFTALSHALEILNQFENEVGAPFIYNFQVQFSEKFTDKLLCFYSFLFHVRTLVALDHNAYVEDTTFECIKCDSITDYLLKSDFTVNDALLYWQFKKLATPFIGHKDKDVRIEKLFVAPMERAFFQYNHNACALIDNLPQSFLTAMSQTELEHALHHVQMDWLLGTGCGLLFRIREEIFGICHGYDKIFWPEASEVKTKKASSLKICFELKESDVFDKKTA